MALTHRITKRVNLEHEPGEWLEVRQPSLDILDRAAEAQLLDQMRLMGSVDLAKLKDLPSGERTKAAEVGAQYDWKTLLGACVIAWSYPEPVTPENVAELDEATVKTVVAALILRDSEEGQKKG